MQNKRLTLNGLTTPNLIYILISVAMMGVSIYLTNHFYQVHFPTGLGGDSLCSINEFWGCDKATLSIFGSIFNVPTAFFGIIIGAIGLFGAIFPSEELERTAKFLIVLNAIGCIILFLYSIIALGGLCPFCTVYYILSLVAAFIFYKHSSVQMIPEIKFLALFAVITVIPAGFMSNHFNEKMATQSSLSNQYVSQFYNLAQPGEPNEESPYKVYQSTENFLDAPVRISLFSDFQCPFCKVVAEQMEEIIKVYKGKVNIQYMFYPLDSACNTNVKGSFHKFACKAAYLSACDKKQFAKVHDFIFARQDKLSFENIAKWEKDFNLSGCFDNKDIQEDIQRTIRAGDQYSLQSTPTMILNGRKLEGSIKTVYLKAIIDEILKRSK